MSVLERAFLKDGNQKGTAIFSRSMRAMLYFSKVNAFPTDSLKQNFKKENDPQKDLPGLTRPSLSAGPPGTIEATKMPKS